ncbi:MAG: hypothetical protein QOI13_544, partial [Paraburkholderia sp.]|nr:hypothetical protein [Paraburkholderia sp.]
MARPKLLFIQQGIHGRHARQARETKLDALRFTTESYPERERLHAWRTVLETMGLRAAEITSTRLLHGMVESRRSTGGFELSVVASMAQTIELDSGAADTAMIALVLDGNATFGADGNREPLAPNDLICVPWRERASLAFGSDFRVFVVRAPRAAIGGRLFAAGSMRAGRIGGDAGIGHVFAAFLRSVSESLDALSADELHPLELALAELIVASLAAHRGETDAARLTPSQAAIFSRVCRSIDARLGDSQISLALIAKEERVSPRYLQKLFEAAGHSFSGYLRSRRLERCRAELVDPLYAKRS